MQEGGDGGAVGVQEGWVGVPDEVVRAALVEGLVVVEFGLDVRGDGAVGAFLELFNIGLCDTLSVSLTVVQVVIVWIQGEVFLAQGPAEGDGQVIGRPGFLLMMMLTILDYGRLGIINTF